MQLVEQHIVKKSSPFYKELSNALWRSKNLYNSTTYAVRQYYFQNKKYLSYYQAQNLFQTSHQPDYEALPRKVSQQTMRMVDQNFRSFFASIQYQVFQG
jgi:putative transposase